MKNRTTTERKSERELVVTRTFNGPAPHRVRGVDPARVVQAVVGAKVNWPDTAFLRDGRPHRGGGKTRVDVHDLYPSEAFRSLSDVGAQASTGSVFTSCVAESSFRGSPTGALPASCAPSPLLLA
jgi:hypothetical protein